MVNNSDVIVTDNLAKKLNEALTTRVSGGKFGLLLKKALIVFNYKEVYLWQ